MPPLPTPPSPPDPQQAWACWLAEPGRAELRPEPLRAPGPTQVQVRALHSGISHGTETLVFRGEVPASAVCPLPQGLPPARAVLAADMEAALNALWDAPAPMRALALLGDDRLDALTTHHAPFAQLPAVPARLAHDSPGVLCHRIDYD